MYHGSFTIEVFLQIEYTGGTYSRFTKYHSLPLSAKIYVLSPPTLIMFLCFSRNVWMYKSLTHL